MVCRKHIFVLFFVSFVAIILSSCATNKIVTTTHSEFHNEFVSVKDFGAVGDGKHDDTDAILRALEYIKKQRKSRKKIKQYNLRVYLGTVKTLFFPSGIYLISREIPISEYQRIKGEDAVLVAHEDGTKIGIRGVGWQVKLEGIQFVGFDEAINLDNKNLDIGQIIIKECSFYENQTSVIINAQSSLTTISNCRFVRNEKVLFIHSGDKVVFEENWISAGTLKGDHDAQIVNYGMLHFVRNLLVPSRPAKGAFEPAWINNYSSLDVSGVRQGGESGSFTLVNNFAEADKTYPRIPRSITVRDSDCYAVYGNRKDFKQPAVIRFLQMPNSILISNVRGIVDSRLIGFGEKISFNKSIFDVLKDNDINILLENIVGGMDEVRSIKIE